LAMHLANWWASKLAGVKAALKALVKAKRLARNLVRASETVLARTMAERKASAWACVLAPTLVSKLGGALAGGLAFRLGVGRGPSKGKGLGQSMAFRKAQEFWLAMELGSLLAAQLGSTLARTTELGLEVKLGPGKALELVQRKVSKLAARMAPSSAKQLGLTKEEEWAALWVPRLGPAWARRLEIQKALQSGLALGMTKVTWWGRRLVGASVTRWGRTKGRGWVAELALGKGMGLVQLLELAKEQAKGWQRELLWATALAREWAPGLA
jgi:hypothetical protein